VEIRLILAVQNATYSVSALGHKQPLKSLAGERLLTAKSGHWQITLAVGKVEAHSLITITATHAKNPKNRTNNDHASQGRERRMAIPAPRRSMGNIGEIQRNLGVPNKYREYGLTMIAATTSHANCLRIIPIIGRASISTIADHPNRIGQKFNIFRYVLTQRFRPV
jgi:hypothetical protein